jgi:hypothetical protein
VFGVAGIANHLGLNVEVDYSLPVEDLYSKKMKTLLLQEAEALMYTVCGAEGSKLQLPSWVPDISFRSQQSALPLGLYHAGGFGIPLKLAESSFSTDTRLLRIRGFVFDVVAECTAKFDSGTNWRLENFRSVERQFLASASQPSPYRDNQDSYQAYWRTLIANCRENFQEDAANCSQHQLWPHLDNGAQSEAFIKRDRSIETNEPDMGNEHLRMAHCEDFTLSATRRLHGRRMFITRRGYFGLGDEKTQQGDQIVVVDGLEMPLILRKVSKTLLARFIGPTYVHGIMNGEFIEEKWKAAGQLNDPQIFEIE